jgi:hypothetical protein
MADLRFKSWSASRLDDYNACPFMAMHKHLLKTCPMCFKGKLKGYPDAWCDTCGKKRPVAGAMARGGLIGEELEKYVNGKAKTLTKEIKNEQARDLAKTLRTKYKLGGVKTEMQISFDRNFKVLGQGWSPEIWFIAKLDVWELVDDKVMGKIGCVLDWKTGGVDKNTKEIKAAAKYGDQLLSYKVAGLCRFPEVGLTRAALCFVDAAGNPIIEDEEVLYRKDLDKAKKKLVKLSLPIMSDTRFAPTSSYRCTYCDFAKRKGGPCKLGA